MIGNRWVTTTDGYCDVIRVCCVEGEHGVRGTRVYAWGTYTAGANKCLKAGEVSIRITLA